MSAVLAAEQGSAILLRGGVLEHEREVAWQGLHRNSHAAFVVRSDTSQDDLAFTLAVLVFHAMGLDYWQSTWAREPDGDPEVLGIIALAAPRTSALEDEQRYTGIGALERRRSHPYLRVRDVGPIGDTRLFAPPIEFTRRELRSRIRGCDRQPTERFFVGPSQRRLQLAVDAWPCCESAALSILQLEPWLLTLHAELQ